MSGYRFLKFLTLYCCALTSCSSAEKSTRTLSAATMLATASASVTGKGAPTTKLASSSR